jgi:hypothetical protein
MYQNQELKLEVSPDLLYSPDMASGSFHLFWSIKDSLCSLHFRLDEVVKEAVHDWQAWEPNGFLS